MFFILLSLFIACVTAEAAGGEESALLRLNDVPAAQAFIDSSEVAVIGFFETDEARGYKEFLTAAKQMESLSVSVCGEKEVWAKYNITSDTISIFRKADVHQKHLKLSEAKTVDADGLVRFFTINNIHYLTEYNQASAVGLFQSEVKTHLLLIANRDMSDFNKLKEKLRALAPKYTGKMLFVLVNGREKSNALVLDYFKLRSRDLPRIAIYDGDSDRKWLMPKGEISTERVQNFCDSYLRGDLQKQSEAETSEDKTEL
ncbi:Endoplasmic reticulum resident protein 27 [Triplophysa tibetana]|uniref:Endoplasmic reticulum resident protein 27 n=1 Tax=Triplophysa tibetana TaxID=1572043 RepID=A0A5A9NW73_9TELE|nr:Endoplasmic reticulum resident protein 27 [Triplophysa tibetana]